MRLKVVELLRREGDGERLALRGVVDRAELRVVELLLHGEGVPVRVVDRVLVGEGEVAGRLIVALAVAPGAVASAVGLLHLLLNIPHPGLPLAGLFLCPFQLDFEFFDFGHDDFLLPSM